MTGRPIAGTGKREHIQITLDPELLRELDARRGGAPRSYVLAEALRAWLDGAHLVRRHGETLGHQVDRVTNEIDREDAAVSDEMDQAELRQARERPSGRDGG